MKIFNFNTFINGLIQEKSIGSEAIRAKFYSDIDKKTFYTLVNLDPTSLRKKDFSKPGDYTRWLLIQYKKIYNSFVKLNPNRVWSDADKKFLCEKTLEKLTYKDLNFHLFIFSSNWFKKEAKAKGYNTDILKFKSTREFRELIEPLEEEFKKQTENAKFDVAYQDSKVKILIPLNFTAAAETAKNTDWCTTKLPNYKYWSQTSLMFRILPTDSKFDKLKITWLKDAKKDRFNFSWYVACSEYPEMGGPEGNPFDIIDGRESWAIALEKHDEELYNEKFIKSEIEKIDQEIKKMNQEKEELEQKEPTKTPGFLIGGPTSEITKRKRQLISEIQKREEKLFIFEHNINGVAKWPKNSKKIKETLSLLSPQAKQAIVHYYEKFGVKDQ